MAKKVTTVTIRTTRETTFTLDQWRAFFGENMTATQMRRDLANDNGQAAHQYAEIWGSEIVHQTWTVETEEN